MNKEKIKTAWICANASADLKHHFQQKLQASGGWIDALLDEMKKREETQLFYFFFSTSQHVHGLELDGVKYYSFSEANQVSIDFLKSMDVIHVYGTENIMVDALVHSVDARKVVVSIQGLKSEIAKDYLNGLEKSMKGLPFLVRKGITAVQKVHQRNYWKDGLSEREVLKKVSHVIGRTHWDRQCVLDINPEMNYHKCQELLREPFYDVPKWNIASCNKHSIYIAQGNYTVKGIHTILKSMALLRKKYPDLKVRISGDNILKDDFLLTRLGLNYAGLIRRLIEMHDLSESVEYIGVLNAQQVKQELLSCNVFLLPSLIENSPNSVGEALLTGVPVVASDVGGVRSLCAQNKAFRLYEADNDALLEKHIEAVFDWDCGIESDLVINQKHAERQYHKEQVGSDLVKIYLSMTENGKGMYENQ